MLDYFLYQRTNIALKTYPVSGKVQVKEFLVPLYVWFDSLLICFFKYVNISLPAIFMPFHLTPFLKIFSFNTYLSP
jgi:hypothetical protein